MRLATPDDNEQLLEIFSNVPMEGDLIVATERGPDFFALYRQQNANIECWVYERNNRILGLGTIVSREGFVQGKKQRVAYLGDLRAAPEVRGALPRFYGRVFSSFCARTGCEHFYTGVLASNGRALQALTRRSAHRKTQPRYELLRRYNAVQVQFTTRPKPYTGRYHVRRATPGDIPLLEKFLAQDHQQRPFGYCYESKGASLGEFAQRLTSWREFALENTYLAYQGYQLQGLCTAWDARAVKRYRVLAYRGKMRLVRRGFNLGARAMGFTPLPPEGECFRYFYLANLSIPSQNPEILRALVSALYRDYYGQGYHFMMLYLEENNPLQTGLRGYTIRPLGFHLYAVRAPDLPTYAYNARTTGFEIALG